MIDLEHSDRPELTEGFLGWTAGIIDGEGHITIQQRKPGRSFPHSAHDSFSMYVRVGNTDFEMVDALHRAWGGSLRLARPRTHIRADVYQWCVQSSKALAMLISIEPFLVVKKTLAALCIEFQKRQSSKIGLYHRSPDNKIVLSDEEVDVRSDYFRKVRSLTNLSRKYLNQDVASIQ